MVGSVVVAATMKSGAFSGLPPALSQLPAALLLSFPLACQRYWPSAIPKHITDATPPEGTASPLVQWEEGESVKLLPRGCNSTSRETASLSRSVTPPFITTVLSAAVPPRERPVEPSDLCCVRAVGMSGRLLPVPEALLTVTVMGGLTSSLPARS